MNILVGKMNAPSRYLMKKLLDRSSPASTTFVAHLTSHRGEKADRRKPWNYKEKGFRWWHIFMDYPPAWRFDDNTKIIVIDGNIATGKTELGKKIAKEFDLLYVPDINNDDMCDLIPPVGVDIRPLDDQLPVKARTCDFERFYSQASPKKQLENFPRIQYDLFKQKTFRYALSVMAHILNTGQGVVMNRGMYSDLVFAIALRKNGFMSAPALKAYKYQWKVTMDYFFHPHLVIYLDAPISLIQDRIKKRNVPWEVNSPVLTDEFLNSISEAYKNEYLPYMSKHCEVLIYDLVDTPVLDIDAVTEDLEKLELYDSLDYPGRFLDWFKLKSYHINSMRGQCSVTSLQELSQIFTFMPPLDSPELYLQGSEAIAFKETVLENPEIYYDPNYRPEDSKRLLKLY